MGDGLILADIAAGTVVGYLAVRCPERDGCGRHPNLARSGDRLAECAILRGSVPYAQAISDRVV